MEFPLYNNTVLIDGRMDEPAWEAAPAYGGFSLTVRSSLTATHGDPVGADTTAFKVLKFADRVIFGIQCRETHMSWLKNAPALSWGPEAGIEIFLSPSGNPYDFYQFYVSAKGDRNCRFYDEGGNIRPDPYGPEWKAAVWHGEDCWSVEVELPLTAFYMTAAGRWSDRWLVNVVRTHRTPKGSNFSSTWCPDIRFFMDSSNFPEMADFPVRPDGDDVYISHAGVAVSRLDAAGYHGTMHLTAKAAKPGVFTFTSDHSEAVTLSLEAGSNTFSVPCLFEKNIRYKVALCLTREQDGTAFRRTYPVHIDYAPIVLTFTAPEFRTNFYPGQDCSRIIGRCIAAQPATLTLVGPGIPRQTVFPDAEGNFSFETPDFQVGEAILTVTAGVHTLTRKIRRLAPTGHMMTWISRGNLVVDGTPVFCRRMSAVGWHGGEAFRRKYQADNLRETRQIISQTGTLQAGKLLPGSESPGAEATVDGPLSEEMRRRVDQVLEANRDRDFAYYAITDEPECRGISRIYLKHLYDYITEKDPYHVVRLSTRSPDEYLDIADWFETHPYINPYTNRDGQRVYGRRINTVGSFVETVSRLNRPDKCIGFLSTCYGAAKTRQDPYPTFDEILCHIWAATVRGAKSLCSYAYHDMNDRPTLYEGCRYMFSSMEALEDILLLGQRQTLVQTPEIESVLYTHGDEKMFVLVNMTNEPQQVTLDGLDGQWYAFRQGEMITKNAFALGPLQVVIGTSVPKDTGLPTYGQTRSLIEALEQQRVSGGSLLFERRADIAVTASRSVGYTTKLFDGVRDTWAWQETGDWEKFYELELTKINPVFSRVVISGWHLEGMALKFRNGSILTPAPVREILETEFSTTFLLYEPVCPQGLRLEFTARSVELYEIEVF